MGGRKNANKTACHLRRRGPTHLLKDKARCRTPDKTSKQCSQEVNSVCLKKALLPFQQRQNRGWPESNCRMPASNHLPPWMPTGWSWASSATQRLARAKESDWRPHHRIWAHLAFLAPPFLRTFLPSLAWLCGCRWAWAGAIRMRVSFLSEKKCHDQFNT